MQFWDKKGFFRCAPVLLGGVLFTRASRPGASKRREVQSSPAELWRIQARAYLILRITEMTRHKMPVNELHTERVKILLSKTLTGMPLEDADQYCWRYYPPIGRLPQTLSTDRRG